VKLACNNIIFGKHFFIDLKSLYIIAGLFVLCCSSSAILFHLYKEFNRLVIAYFSILMNFISYVL